MSEIPDDIKIAAENALGDGPEHMLPDYGVNEGALVDVIARAILAERDASKALCDEMAKALKPFSTAAGALFTRDWNSSDVVFAIDHIRGHAGATLTAGDLFASRRALAAYRKEKEVGNG